jgi:hypothetical protein
MKNKISFRYLQLLALGFVLILTNGCKKNDDTIKYSIGQSYGGGLIYYIDDTGQHGLIAAPSDQAASVPWSNLSNITTNANGSDIGTGMANTITIVTMQGAGNYAAKICNDLVLDGFSDWFLPSKSECFLMYFNLKIMKGIGDFSDVLYWSSTEASINNAYSQYSNDGYPPNGGYYKTSSYSVRAVRTF